MNLTPIRAVSEMLNASRSLTRIPSLAELEEEARLIEQGDRLLASLESEKVRWHREVRDREPEFVI